MTMGGAGRTTNRTASTGPGRPARRSTRGSRRVPLSGATAWQAHAQDDDFGQAGELYRLMSPDEQERLVQNLAGSLGQVSRGDIIERSIGHLRAADPGYGERVAAEVEAQRS